jgi:spermidine synthase
VRVATLAPGRPRVVVSSGLRGTSLRIDGTHASLFRPGRTSTGSVWDALAAPLLWLPRGRRRNVLVLGLGGGSAARLVRAIAPRARIVGVEWNAEVIRAARRWFDVDALGLEIVHADAQRYLARCRKRFDVVIDDVFVGGARTVRKPQWLLDTGLAVAARRLRPGGLLVANSIDEFAAVARALRALFPALLQMQHAEYDNRILVGGPRGLSGGGLRQAVAASPILREVLPQMSFRRLLRRSAGDRPARVQTAIPRGPHCA